MRFKNHWLKAVLLFDCLFISLALAACSSAPKNSLQNFEEDQKRKVVSQSLYDDGILIFSAAAYKPTLDDLALLKQRWFEFGNSFPESQSIKDIEEALRDHHSSAMLVALYMTEYENADLRNKTKGWAVGPTPTKIKELDDNDVPVSRLMPVGNPWARFFLVKFDKDTPTQKLTVSNGFTKVDLKLVTDSHPTVE